MSGIDLRFRDVSSGQSDYRVRVERKNEGYQVTVGEHTYHAAVSRHTPGELTFTVDGEAVHAHLATDGTVRYVAFDALVYELSPVQPERKRRAASAGDASLAASMHGQVVRVEVAEGDAVTRGQTLVILEAMKMEMRVTAPHDGRVSRVMCAPGQVVERGQPLLELVQ